MLCCCPKRNFIDDEFQFCIKQCCDGEIKTVWEAQPQIIDPFGTLVVKNTGYCPLRIFVNGSGSEEAFLVPGQTFSKTYDSLKSVQIKCCRTAQIKCCGIVCISLHYEKLC